MRNLVKAFILGSFTAALTLHSQTILSIANAGFESPSGPASFFTGADWQSPGGSNGIVPMSGLPPGAYNVGVTAPVGLQIGFINANGVSPVYDNIYQDVGVNFVTGSTYTFSAYFGRRTDGANPTATGSIQIRNTGGTLLAATNGITPTTGANFVLGSVTYTAGIGDNGMGIRVQIVDEVNNIQLNFDQAQLTAIPEPSTYTALAGLGALGLAALRRRRKP